MASALTIAFGDGSRTDKTIVEYPLDSPTYPGTRNAVDAGIRQNLCLIYSSEEVEPISEPYYSRTRHWSYDFGDILWRGRGSSSQD